MWQRQRVRETERNRSFAESSKHIPVNASENRGVIENIIDFNQGPAATKESENYIVFNDESKC